MEALLSLPKHKNAPEQKSEQWLQLRRQHFTSTEMYTILHGKNRDLSDFLDKKMGKNTYFTNPAVEHGNKFEEVALEKFATLFNVKPLLCNVLYHKDIAGFIFSPDALLQNGDIIEIKNPYSRKINGSVSLQYFYQVQLGMEVMRSHGFLHTKAWFVEYKPRNHSYEPENEILSVQIIERDPDFFPKVLDKSKPLVEELKKYREYKNKSGCDIDFDGFLTIY